MKPTDVRTTALADGLRPSSPIGLTRVYAPPCAARPPRCAPLLKLDANEGPQPDEAVLQQLTALAGEQIRRYPTGAELESRIADRFGVTVDRVLITAGADDAIDRVCRAMLGPGRRAVILNPTFEMIPRYVRLTHAEPVAVPWLESEFPIAELHRTLSIEDIAAVFIDSPNNPTGAVADAEDLVELARRRPDVLFAADLAYVEFADHDPTMALLEQPNVVIARTFSKAFGLAGLRVGYTIGNEAVINWLRAAGHPYPVSSVSLTLVTRAIDDSKCRLVAYVQRVRDERSRLAELLRGRGVPVTESQGNFVLGTFGDAWRIADALLEQGILVRRFERPGLLADRLRITCPGSPADLAILTTGLEQVLSAGDCPS